MQTIQNLYFYELGFYGQKLTTRYLLCRCSFKIFSRNLEQVPGEYLERIRGLNIKNANELVQHLKHKIDIVLNYPNLDKASLPIKVYSGASFASSK